MKTVVFTTALNNKFLIPVRNIIIAGKNGKELTVSMKEGSSTNFTFSSEEEAERVFHMICNAFEQEKE